MYGCASARAPSFAWQSWVFEGLKVRGCAILTRKAVTGWCSHTNTLELIVDSSCSSSFYLAGSGLQWQSLDGKQQS